MTELEQIVYLSNRPDVLAETLEYVRHFMPWIRRGVVLVPSSSAASFGQLAAASGSIELTIVTEPEVLAESDVRLADHGARNSLLRRRLAERGPLDEVFLQSDDDYRPLKPVAPSLFVEANRLHSYASYDLAGWRRAESSYDRVQHAAYLTLSYLDCQHLCYAAHMPQPLDRALMVEAFAAADRIGAPRPSCEWSLPINYSRTRSPDRFHPARTFRTLGWPQYPHQWPYWRRPEDLTFENFYPESYAPGQLFDGISTRLDAAAPERQAMDKITRWYDFDLAFGRLRFTPDVADPWRTNRRRRALFAALRRVRTLYEYVALEERTQLSELAGTVAALTPPSESVRPDPPTPDG